MFHQHGTKIAQSQGAELKACGFVFLPKRCRTRSGRRALFVLQVNGNGPFSLDCLDPAEAPSEAMN